MVQYCQNCGNEIEDSDKFCKKCGEGLLSQQRKKNEKPVVIIIVAILFGIMGILEILSGLVIAAVGPIIGTEIIPFVGGFVILSGVIFTGLGVLDIAVAYGLWELKRWGGILGIVLGIISLLFSLPFVTIDYGFSVLLSVLMIVLIAVGWGSLE